MTSANVYTYFDGDDVGSWIELCLLRGDVDGAAAQSVRVHDAIAALAASLQSRFSAKIMFVGGDEVLALIKESVSADELHALRGEFKLMSGLTISCGWATTARDATLNLRIAKLRGKNQVQGPASD